MRVFADDMKEKPKEADLEVGDEALDLHYMKKKDRFQHSMRKEKEKLSDLKGSQKIAYILDYYKWHFIITVLVLFVAFSIGRAVYINSRPVALRMAVLNATFENADAKESFKDDLEEKYKAALPDDLTGTVNVEADYIIDPINYMSDTMNSSSSTMTDYEMLGYKIQNNYYDVILTDEDGFTYCKEQDLIYPVDSYFSKDTIDQYKEFIVQGKNLDGKIVSFAFDISDTNFVKEAGLSYTPVYLVVSCASEKNIKRAEAFLSYVYEQ